MWGDKHTTMKSNILFTVFFFALLVVTACKKEAPIETDEFDPEYKLPQGDHPYDRSILDFYQKYGTYILYKFNSKDLRWNVTGNIPYVAEPGDEAYIAPALEALNKYLFSYYPEVFLKKALPYKIILSNKLCKIFKDPQTGLLDTLDHPENAASSVSHLAFGHASSRLAQLKPEELLLMKSDLHREFWLQAIHTGKLELAPLFPAATDYAMANDFNKKEYGVFNISYTTAMMSDFGDYLTYILSHSYKEMEATLFNPENDPKGRFFYKYKLIVDYYKIRYQVDLQAISDAAN